MQSRGINHIHVTREKLTAQYIIPDGKLIHAFERSIDGTTKVLPE